MASLLLAASTEVDDFAGTLLKEVTLIHQALRNDNETMLINGLRKWPGGPRGNTYEYLSNGSLEE